jgi:GTP-binding protein Era
MGSHRCGTIGIAGRPNTGKSSLLNRLVGEKVSIVSRRAQTTRHLITGILTTPDCQYIFVDAPGQQSKAINTLNRRLNRRATEAARDADVALFVVEALRFGPDDHAVLEKIPQSQRVVVAVNKVDNVKHSAQLLPYLERLSQTRDFAAIVPVSAKSGKNIPALMKALRDALPEGEAIYPPDQLTDRDERFFAAELLREKLFEEMGAEMPYRCEVVIDSFKEEGNLRRIEATILVERDSQKPIVLGAGGSRLKKMATAARKDMEKLFGGKVYLGTFVKVRKSWTDDVRVLHQLGYD